MQILFTVKNPVETIWIIGARCPCISSMWLLAFYHFSVYVQSHIMKQQITAAPTMWLENVTSALIQKKCNEKLIWSKLVRAA